MGPQRGASGGMTRKGHRCPRALACMIRKECPNATRPEARQKTPHQASTILQEEVCGGSARQEEWHSRIGRRTFPRGRTGGPSWYRHQEVGGVEWRLRIRYTKYVCHNTNNHVTLFPQGSNCNGGDGPGEGAVYKRRMNADGPAARSD